MTKTANNIFEETANRNADRAQKQWEKNERKLKRIRIGLIIAAVSHALLFLMNALETKGIYTFDNFLFILWIGCMVVAYVLGGGILAALKRCWGLTKKLFFIGWLCVPFPMDIFSGLFLSVLGIGLFPIALIFAPILLIFLNYRDAKKEKDAIEYSILCGAPVNGSFSGAGAV